MPESKRLRIAAFALVLALLGATAACGGSNDEAGSAQKAESQEITINWGAEPPSLDPGLATDTTSANILLNIMDPLVKLDENLEPVPNLAERWDVSENGKTVTFHLRDGGAWTNGDAVTAHDFEYSWKRTLDPKLGADYAYQFYGIVGAQDYNECEANCARVRDRVGVKALDDTRLQVQLTSAQPWFLQQVAHHSFLPVHRGTVERHGAKWTEAANIVTNGPFRLVAWEHDARIDLAKWDQWREADRVSLQRVNGLMLTEGTSAMQAFDAGQVDVNLTIPPSDIPRRKETPEYGQYPALGTYYYGVNLKNVRDVNQRRAMSLAIDRRQIIDRIAQGDQIPASGFTPKGMPGFETINPASEWMPETADLERAKELMAQVKNPKRKVTLFYNSDPAHKSIAIAVQAQWKKLGLNAEIKAQEWKQFLQFLGPPPNNAVDAYRLGWIGDYVDAMNFLELWTCESGNNNTNFCDRSYDQLVEKARSTRDDQERFEIYAQLEDKLFGPDGAMPIIPIYFYTYTTLERESIKDSFNLNLLDQVDLTEVEVVES
jgi:ABC-type oligopeptide transport system substrate-binding subunit